MTATIAVDGQIAELSQDAHGLVGHIVIDGVPHRVFATVTPAGPRAMSPAQWMQHN